MALVTGTSSGFGRLTAQALARDGALVFAGMRDPDTRNAGPRADLVRWAEDQDLRLAVVELDVTDEASVARAVEDICARAGGIDVLVNNAGVMTGYGPMESFTVAQIRQMFEVNVFGAMAVTRAALPHMRGRPGALVVWLSSGLGRVVIPTMGAYSTCKFALEALAEAYRYELAESGIDSVIVQPGAYPTKMGKALIEPGDPARLAHYQALIAAGERLRAGFQKTRATRVPREVAELIARLVALPAGRRQLRTRIGGEDLPIDSLNQAAADTQHELFARLGLADIVRLKS